MRKSYEERRKSYEDNEKSDEQTHCRLVISKKKLRRLFVTFLPLFVTFLSFYFFYICLGHLFETSVLVFVTFFAPFVTFFKICVSWLGPAPGQPVPGQPAPGQPAGLFPLAPGHPAIATGQSLAAQIYVNWPLVRGDVKSSSPQIIAALKPNNFQTVRS